MRSQAVKMQAKLSSVLCVIAVATILFAGKSSASDHCSDDCRPSFLVDPPSTTEWEAEMEAKCFTACVDLLSMVCNCSIDLFPSPELLTLWNTFGIVDKESIDCSSYQKASDCQRGCMVKARNSNMTKDSCKEACDDSCPGDYKDTDCPVNCDPEFCGHGCDIYDTYLNETHSSAQSPTTPMNKPILMSDSNNRNGVFIYSTSHHTDPTPTTALDGSGDNGPIPDTVSFLFKIETGNVTVYIWKWIYYGNIDLDFASCQELTISFKAVSKFSTSEYSPLLHSCGEKQYPHQINLNTELDFYFIEDFRPGFDKQAEAIISWQKPPGSQFLTKYELSLTSQSVFCGGTGATYTYNIDKDATNYTLQADNPGGPIRFQCQYLVQFISKPTNIKSQSLPYTAVRAESVSAPNPTLSINCATQYKANGMIDLLAVWQVSSYPGIIEAMEKYTIHTQRVDYRTAVPTTVEWSSPIPIIPNVNETVNIAILPDMEPLNENFKYHLRVDAVSNHKYPWRQMPTYVTCIVDAHPQPPETVNISTAVIVNQDFNHNFLFLNMTWNYPSVLNGIAIEFEVRIAREYLEPTKMDDPTDYSLRKDTVGNSTFIVLNATQIYQLDKLPCLFVQIRCQNNYNLWSNWSDPMLIKKYPEHDPECTGKEPMPSVPAQSATSSSTILTHSSTSIPNSAEDEIPIFIIGIVVTCLVAVTVCVIFCAIICVFGRRYRRRNRYLEAFKELDFDPMYVGGLQNTSDTVTSKLLHSPSLDEWEIPAGQVIIENRLGEGCFGEVYQGTIKGPISNSKIQASLKNTICPVVAIKLLKTTASGRERVDFLLEIDTMKRVTKGNNPHVVNMVGCVTIQEPLCLITEFIKYGDLSAYLKSIRKAIMEKRQVGKPNGAEPYLVPRADDCNNKCEAASDVDSMTDEIPYSELGDLDNINLLSFAYQIASGMEYLASIGIVHRDLACRNILVGEGKSLKISDFGMSRLVEADDVYVKNTKGRLPWKWMAIESIVNREFTSASDVWSYGVAIWEIATLGGFPYPTILNADLLEHLQRGLRLEKPDNCSAEVYDIILQCWDSNPNERPTFTSLRAKFDALITAQKDHNPYIDLEIDCQKPYYNPLLATDGENNSSSGISTESSSIQHDTCNVMRTRIGNISCEELPRPISNPYVDSPTNHVRSLSMAFAEASDSNGHFGTPRDLRRSLKGSLQLTEFV